jgi:hypothetical protein
MLSPIIRQIAAAMLRSLPAGGGRAIQRGPAAHAARAPAAALWRPASARPAPLECADAGCRHPSARALCTAAGADPSPASSHAPAEAAAHELPPADGVKAAFEAFLQDLRRRGFFGAGFDEQRAVHKADVKRALLAAARQRPDVLFSLDPGPVAAVAAATLPPKEKPERKTVAAVARLQAAYGPSSSQPPAAAAGAGAEAPEGAEAAEAAGGEDAEAAAAGSQRASFQDLLRVCWAWSIEGEAAAAAAGAGARAAPPASPGLAARRPSRPWGPRQPASRPRPPAPSPAGLPGALQSVLASTTALLDAEPDPQAAQQAAAATTPSAEKMQEQQAATEAKRKAMTPQDILAARCAPTLGRRQPGCRAARCPGCQGGARAAAAAGRAAVPAALAGCEQPAPAVPPSRHTASPASLLNPAPAPAPLQAQALAGARGGAARHPRRRLVLRRLHQVQLRALAHVLRLRHAQQRGGLHSGHL